MIETVVLFFHGFGIRKENLGLFTFLADKYNNLGFSTVLFDYYNFDYSTKEILTVPFSKQAVILQNQIDRIRKEYPKKDIKIIAHSQGCFIPTICDITRVSEVIAISPFFLTDKDSVYKRYTARKGNVTDFEKVSRRPHSDGTVTIIPPEYWQERFKVNIYESYNRLALKTKLTMIYGTKDEVLNDVDIKKFKNAEIIGVKSNHDFTEEYREEVFEILSTKL